MVIFVGEISLSKCVLCLAVKLTTGGSVENWKPKGRVFFFVLLVFLFFF